ncbi:putative AT hook motif-containing protein [Cinnamomum micranthum f. kanehirae]|uniref:Putative AT hook motif-containing protein n=1 Tax=Cinnamomum micranthum f. kanehirae TaxID=337451 RepID=A0A443P2V6_9MAGN|nr:putative AT hook motif-containing protein [Cinnamomum micranthum f. kanehirae]
MPSNATRLGIKPGFARNTFQDSGVDEEGEEEVLPLLGPDRENNPLKGQGTGLYAISLGLFISHKSLARLLISTSKSKKDREISLKGCIHLWDYSFPTKHLRGSSFPHQKVKRIERYLLRFFWRFFQIAPLRRYVSPLRPPLPLFSSLNQIETNENLIDVQINVVGLNNIGNLSEKSNAESGGATSSSDNRPIQPNRSSSGNINQGIVDHQDAITEGDTDASSVGHRFILPSSYTGGPRYLVQQYQDAMAICRWAGPPDLFVTFTCNPYWKEIQDMIASIPGQRVKDRPDIFARVFRLKLKELIDDLRKRMHFGFVIAGRNPSVERLQFHLKDQQTVVFRDDSNLRSIVNNPNNQRTMFTKWFETNKRHSSARELTYVDFPTKWNWDENAKVLHVNEDLRTINGETRDTFKDACAVLGLLDDDGEWDDALTEASNWATGNQLRHMFSGILRSLKDILADIDENAEEKIFGGMTVALEGLPQTAQNITPIQDYEIFERLTPFRIHWKIKARVCRIWHEFEVQKSVTRKRFVRVLLIDEKGEQMQLTLQDTEIQSLGVNLREGIVVSIDHVKVVDAQKAYKVVPSDYQIYLRHDSITQEIKEGCSDIPLDRFYFKTFDELPSLVTTSNI